MVRYTDSLKGVTPGMLVGFFEGWKSPHDPETHLDILRRSDFIILAFDSGNRKVVGFVTALTDHVQAAFIPLLEVLPAYRGRGIGTQLVKRMLKKLERIPAVDLTCDPAMQAFYARFGMLPSRGMVLRKYDRRVG